MTIATEKTFTLTLTENEINLIRSALCVKSMKTLCKAQADDRELKALGRGDEKSLAWETHAEIKKIIATIDSIKE